MPVEHLDRTIGEPGIEVDDRRDQRRAAPVKAIIGEQERRRNATFAHELREPEVGDFRADRRAIGGASCRERVCQYVSISVAAVTLKNKSKESTTSATVTLIQKQPSI